MLCDDISVCLFTLDTSRGHTEKKTVNIIGILDKTEPDMIYKLKYAIPTKWVIGRNINIVTSSLTHPVCLNQQQPSQPFIFNDTVILGR